MKLGIISDVHGNLSALTAVLDSLDEMGATKIFCLGDTAGYYSEINGCCDLLRERSIHTLLGNHDWYLITGNRSDRSNAANRCIDYQNNIVSKENFDWLSSLSPKFDNNRFSFRHGGWNDPIDEYVSPSKEYFSDLIGDFFCSGHTHIPLIAQFQDVAYCNPGSVGQPRDGDPRSSFATFSEGKFSLHRVEYDIEKTQYLMKIAGFDSYFYANLSLGLRIGKSLS